MLKKVGRFISLLLAVITLIVSVPLQTVAVEDSLLVGVCCHPSNPYAQNWEDMVYYTAKMGGKIIRIDLQGIDAEKWDKFFALCKAYGLEVMGIVYDTTTAEFFSKRYGKQLKYIQVLNETDAEALITGGGEGKGNYNLNKIAELVGKFKEIIPIIRENSPQSKICINVTYLHYGYFEHLLEQDVDFDVAGLDWYSQMDANGTLEATIDEISKITGKPIFICESNIWTNSRTPEENDKEMGKVIIDYIERCKVIQESHNVLGFTAYELFNEPHKKGYTDVIKGEAYFGLIYVNDDYSIDKPKIAYYELQEYLGYKNNNVEKISVSSLDLTQYGSIKNETDDTSNSITSSDKQNTSSQTTNTEKNSQNHLENETIIEPITQTEVVTDTKEVVDIVYEEPETIETIKIKNIYKTKGFPVWLIIEIVICGIITAGTIVIFFLRKKSLKSNGDK